MGYQGGGGALGRVNGFVLQKLLGQGSFGTVYKATRETDGKTYAIKKVDTRKMGAKDRAEAVNEIRVLASVAGAHIITFFEAFVEQDMLYIVTEFAGHGDLFGFLKDARKRGPLKETTVWSLFIQMGLGLKSLHDRNILHRDLKGANVFMCSPTYIKLGDFGVSKVLKSDQALARTQVGTPYYVAPEVWRNRPYNAKCDVWSLGCMLYELCTFRPPFEAESMEGLARKIMRGKYNPIPAGYSRDLQNVVDRLLVVDPARRASIDDILSHPGVQQRMSSVPSPDSLNAPAIADGPVDLVGTIVVPHRFNDLHKNLPPSRYEAPAKSVEAPVPDVIKKMSEVSTRSPAKYALDAQGRTPFVPRGQQPSPGQMEYKPPLQVPVHSPYTQGQQQQQQQRPGEPSVPTLPPVPGAQRRAPPVSASAAAARQLAQPGYRQQQPVAAAYGRAPSRPGSAAARPGSAASRPGSANIRVVYHNPHGYHQQGRKGSIFRTESESSMTNYYNPITHQKRDYHVPGGLYQPRNAGQVNYQSRLARIHNPTQQQAQLQAMYAAQGRMPMQRRA